MSTFTPTPPYLHTTLLPTTLLTLPLQNRSETTPPSYNTLKSQQIHTVISTRISRPPRHLLSALPHSNHPNAVTEPDTQNKPSFLQLTQAIPVIIRKRRSNMNLQNLAQQQNPQHLRPIKPMIPPQNPSTKIPMALWNIRSLTTKTFIVNEFINTHNLACLFLFFLNIFLLTFFLQVHSTNEDN